MAEERAKKKKKKFFTFARKKSMTGYLFLTPWLIGGIFLLVYPLVFSFRLSFSELQNFTTYAMKWVGLTNYKKAFLGDVHFVTCIMWALRKILLESPIIVIFSLIVAIMVSRNIKGKGFFRSIFFLPVLLGTGYVMDMLNEQGITVSSMEVTRDILLSPTIQSYLPEEMFKFLSTLLEYIPTVLWGSGVQIVLFLIGIQKIPQELYESARVDSATEWEMFWKITLPMISPIILLNAVYTIIASYRDSSPLVNWIMYQAFDLGDFEYASTMGWIFFAFVLIVIGLVALCLRPFINRVTKRY